MEAAEKSKDSRLAREFVVALPVELDRERWQALLTEFIQTNFVADGMCADVAIHDTDGHNPHAHIMLTVRPLDENGKWQYKAEKEYLCVRDGEERGFTASEFKEAQKDGWEKQYSYYVDKKKKEYLPPSKAALYGYERADKHPKSTKYGRQNPVSARWNSDEQLVLWRSAWADTVNRALERSGIEERIDHRSHAARGLDEQPTVHEGVTARALEKQGVLSDRCELNRQIRRDNALLQELKSTVQKLTEAIKNSIPAVAEAMENARRNVILFCYQLRHIWGGKNSSVKYMDSLKAAMKKYADTVQEIKAARTERKTLQDEKANTHPLKIKTHKNLAARIAALTERLEELQTEKNMLLSNLGCPDDSELSAAKKSLADTEAQLARLQEQEGKYASELNAAVRQYAELKDQASDLDFLELYDARHELRADKETDVRRQIQKAYGEKYSFLSMAGAVQEADSLLNIYDEEELARDLIFEKQMERRRNARPQLKRREDRER